MSHRNLWSNLPTDKLERLVVCQELERNLTLYLTEYRRAMENGRNVANLQWQGPAPCFLSEQEMQEIIFAARADYLAGNMSEEFRAMMARVWQLFHVVA